MSSVPNDQDYMEFSKGYPCLYGLHGGFAIRTESGWTEVVKNGSTWHIGNRKSGAVTYFPVKPEFSYVIVLEKSFFSSQADLYTLDAKFVQFMKDKGYGTYYIEKEGGKEWFYATCPESYLTLRLAFLRENNIPVRAVLTNDPYPVRDLTSEEKETLEKEDTVIQRRKKILQTETLYEKFCRLFLENRVPRRIQTELWQAFSALANPEKTISYKGIVQWPTGCGKTIAILMIIVLAKEYCEKRGELYRGLFISPKNDILDTIQKNFFKLAEFGITVCDGSNAQLSSLTIPEDKHILVMACHNALLVETGMKCFPRMSHIHYDEVHRITGDTLFALVKQCMEAWNTYFLTGTSATPQTSSEDQRRKLRELFGDPLTLLHKCNVDEAVREGWIAKPRFHVRVLEKNKDRPAILENFVRCAVELVDSKGNGGKHIFYIETSMEEVRYAIAYAKRMYPDRKFYTAIDGERNDDEFLKAPVDETSHILFACQRYREGSDVAGLESTGKLVGNVTSAHNLLQISGRALRLDYPEKEGWCMIARPSEPGTTADDVLMSILLEIMDYLGAHCSSGNDARSLVKTYFGNLAIDGTMYSLEETIERIQAAYDRIQFAKQRDAPLVQAHELLELLQTKQINILDHTMATLREEVSRILSRKLPSYPREEWGISLYEIAEQACPGSTQSLRNIPSPRHMYRILNTEGIQDMIDFEEKWAHSIHTKYPDLPGMPTDLWDETFWGRYTPG